MKGTKRLLLCTGLALVAGLMVVSPIAFAYDGSGAYTWVPGDPNYDPSAVISSGTIDTTGLVFGDFLGRSAAQPSAISWGDSGVSVGWDDTWVGGVGDGNTNGDALDGLWAQIYSDGGWWDLGHAATRVAVFTSQDHGPYLAEGLEYRVFGSNTLWDDSSLSSQAVITDVYLDGWRTHNPAEDANGNGWSSDDIAGVYQLPGAYRYIKLVAWTDVGSLNEPEVDAVAAAQIEVAIDIKPGSFPNSINPGSNGVVPVAVLTTDDFDATNVDPDTVVFGPDGASPLRWALEDVDEDGDLDLVLHFDTQETGIAHGDAEATLTGETFDGLDVTGTDSVRTVPPKGK